MAERVCPVCGKKVEPPYVVLWIEGKNVFYHLPCYEKIPPTPEELRAGAIERLALDVLKKLADRICEETFVEEWVRTREEFAEEVEKYEITDEEIKEMLMRRLRRRIG